MKQPIRALLTAGTFAGSLFAVTGCRYGTENCIEQRTLQVQAVPFDASTAGPLPTIETIPGEDPAAPLAPPPLPGATPPSNPGPAPLNTPSAVPNGKDNPAEPPRLQTTQKVAPRPSSGPPASAPVPRQPKSSPAIRQVGHWTGRDAGPRLAQREETRPDNGVLPTERFRIPDELPGADAPPLKLPPFDMNEPPQKRREQIAAIFPKLPAIQDISFAGESVTGPPLSLAELQQIGVQNSPVIRRAAAEVETARGKAIQAGLYPNPRAGYAADSINTARTDGYHGGFISQEFVTAGKLTIAQDAALREMRAKELELKRTRIRLASDIRRRYIDALVAQQQEQFARAVSTISEEVYQAQIELVQAGEAALYEPLQLRIYAVQARNDIVRSHNAYYAAWRRLAAAMGVAGHPPRRLTGSIEDSPPLIDVQAAKELMLSQHTDVGIALARIEKARLELRLARRQPIPNIDVTAAVQADDTSTMNDLAYNLEIGIPIPLFNRNQGNTIAAEAELVRARQDLTETSNRLTGELAEAYNRYITSRQIAATYRTDILRDQVQVYRGITRRFEVAGEAVGFAQLAEIVIAQQSLSQLINEYLDLLAGQWQATVDLAELLQVSDMYALDQQIGGGPTSTSGSLPVPFPEEGPVPVLPPAPPAHAEPPADDNPPPAQ